MSSIQDIHAFAERIYDIVQDYVDGNYNPVDVLAIGRRCGKITMKADAKEATKHNEFLQNDIAKARKWKELGETHSHYFIKDDDILISGDGIQFVVCVEWDRKNIINVLGIAKALGWKFEILK